MNGEWVLPLYPQEVLPPELNLVGIVRTAHFRLGPPIKARYLISIDDLLTR